MADETNTPPAATVPSTAPSIIVNDSTSSSTSPDKVKVASASDSPTSENSTTETKAEDVEQPAAAEESDNEEIGDSGSETEETETPQIAVTEASATIAGNAEQDNETDKAQTTEETDVQLEPHPLKQGASASSSFLLVEDPSDPAAEGAPVVEVVGAQETVLDLSNTGIPSLVKSNIGALLQLKKLLLTNNELVTIPQSVSSLRYLEVLHLSFNKISYIPALDNLTCLKQVLQKFMFTLIFQLFLSNNCLTVFPAQLPPSLERLDLSWNKIQRVPLEISTLTNLEKLNLWNNCIESISPEIMHLTKLKRFAFS